MEKKQNKKKPKPELELFMVNNKKSLTQNPSLINFSNWEKSIFTIR